MINFQIFTTDEKQMLSEELRTRATTMRLRECPCTYCKNEDCPVSDDDKVCSVHYRWISRVRTMENLINRLDQTKEI